MKAKTVIVIGAHHQDGPYWTVSDAITTEKQIEAVRCLQYPDGVVDADDPTHVVTFADDAPLFSSLVEYRRRQAHFSMADRPTTVVVATVEKGGREYIRQIDAYSGHDFLDVHHVLRGEILLDGLPDFRDHLEYGLFDPVFGILKWYARDFQTTLIDRTSPDAALVLESAKTRHIVDSNIDYLQVFMDLMLGGNHR